MWYIGRASAFVRRSWEPRTSHCLAQVLSWWECRSWLYPASWQPLCGTGTARSLHGRQALLPWAAEHNGSDPVSGWDIHFVCECSRCRRLSHVLLGSSAKHPGDRWPVSESGCGFFSLYLFIYFLSSQIIQSNSLLIRSKVTQGHSECVVKTALFPIGWVLGDRQSPALSALKYLAMESCLGGCHPGWIWVSSRLKLGFDSSATLQPSPPRWAVPHGSTEVARLSCFSSTLCVDSPSQVETLCLQHRTQMGDAEPGSCYWSVDKLQRVHTSVCLPPSRHLP